MLQKGDVLVVDACGTQFGGVIGDNLAYYIMKRPALIRHRWRNP
jgi:regulator of RNase E activity RraA